MTIDQVALLPAYAAALTAVAALVTDLIAPGRRAPVLIVTAAGTVVTAAAAVGVPARTTFCTPAGCSFASGGAAAVVGALFALITLGVLAFSVPTLRGDTPPGEYCFLLACSMTGGVVLGSARDLITLIVAVETLTLPLYVLVGLRRRLLA